MDYYLPFGPEIDLGQPFGARPNLPPNPPGGHNGDDWLTQIGTPVRAAGDGVVVFAGQFDETYADNFGWNLNYGGLMVVLNMDGDTAPYFEYGHNSKLLVKSGERVVAGQIIALTGNTDGNTGVSTGPHCHVGCLPYNFNLGTNTYGRVNPRLYMTKHWDGTTLASSGTIITQTIPSEEDDMFTEADRTVINSANIRAEVAMNEATNAKVAARENLAIAAQISNLIGAIAALSKGEPFDEAKLLAGVQAAAAAGVKSAIDSIETTINIKEG